jgi:hypothetical protein
MVMKTKLFITALAIAAITTMASAQEKSTAQDQKAVSQASAGNYVDADKNGVCDYNEANGQNNCNGCGMGKARANHSRQGMAAGQGRGMRSAQGRGMGPGQGKGLAPGGPNFADENKNGICDLRENPADK